MATTANGIVYPVAGDFVAPLNTHFQDLAESVQSAINTKVTYTPTLTGLTLGNGTVSATYVKNGNIIIDDIVITLGSTTVVTGALYIGGMQPAVSSSPADMVVGSVTFHDSGAAWYSGIARQITATSIETHVQNTTGTYSVFGAISATVPHTWATNDRILVRTVRIAA